MAETAEPLIAPAPTREESTEPRDQLDPGYLVICWNDPVNLMPYVTHVFQQIFRWPKERAEKHMIEVHEKGKSILIREGFEKAEHYVHQLHAYSLHATMEPDK